MEELKKENKKLNEKVFDLSVSNEAKGQIIYHMQEEKKETLKMMRKDRTFIGTLKTKLLRLGAPENTLEEEGNNDSNSFIEAEVKNPLEKQNEGN